MGLWNPSELLLGHGQAESSATHSCIFLAATAALIPKARCVAVAASMLDLKLPDADVNASSVLAGERSASMSSVMRGRVGEREGARV
jgi:hypothetical protein